MHEDLDGQVGRVDADPQTADDVTAPPHVPAGPDDTAEAIVSEDEHDRPARVRALGQDVGRLTELVDRLAAAAATLGDRLDGEVRGALDGAEQALAEAREARQAATEAETRAEAAAQQAADAQEELEKGVAAAKASLTAAQESEANAWKEAGAAQQARATSTNEAAHADGLRKRAEAAWSTEHQTRIDAERERDDLAVRLSAEQAALATAQTDLAETRAELAKTREGLAESADTERDLRAELAAVQGQIAGLTVERDSVGARAADVATRVDRAEQRAESAEERAEQAEDRARRAEQRAERAEQRVETAAERADMDGATVRALQDTIRSALDLPSVEDLDGRRGVRVGESGAVTAEADGRIGVADVPPSVDGELGARFARAILAVRVHQATRRARPDDDERAGALDEAGDPPGDPPEPGERTEILKAVSDD